MRALNILIILCAGSASVPAEDDCEPWPSHILTPLECCELPGFVFSRLSLIYEFDCGRSPKKNDCIMSSFLNDTGIIKAGKLDKNAVKQSYFKYEVSMETINEATKAIDECIFEKQENLTQSLLNFFNCVDQNYAKNCPSFKKIDDCHATAEYFYQCKNIEVDCKKFRIDPDCCNNPPKPINSTLTLHCSNLCLRKEIFYTARAECQYSCIAEKTVRNGNIDYDLIRETLYQSVTKAERWEITIVLAFEVCGNEVKGEKCCR